MTPPDFSRYGRGPRIRRYHFPVEPRLKPGDVVLANAQRSMFRPTRILAAVLISSAWTALLVCYPLAAGTVVVGALLIEKRRRANVAFYVERQ